MIESSNTLLHTTSNSNAAITPPDDNHIISAQEAADILGIHYVNLCSYRTAGKGPKFIKTYRNRIIYRLNDVLRWKADNKIKRQPKQPLV